MASPIPRSRHDFLPVPLSRRVSPKMNSFDRREIRVSSSSSPLFTSTSSSFTCLVELVVKE